VEVILGQVEGEIGCMCEVIHRCDFLFQKRGIGYNFDSRMVVY